MTNVPSIMIPDMVLHVWRRADDFILTDAYHKNGEWRTEHLDATPLTRAEGLLLALASAKNYCGMGCAIIPMSCGPYGITPQAVEERTDTLFVYRMGRWTTR